METTTYRIPVDTNTALHVEVTGAGPAIAFIHGLTLDRRMWNDQRDWFCLNYTVIAYDVRGFGASDPPTAGVAYTHAADLKVVLEHLGFASATIVGLSMGGWPALDFALDYPEMADALVLVDSTLWGYTFEPGYGGRLGALFDNWKVDADAARQAWLADDLFRGSRGNPDVVARLTEMVNDCNAWQLSNPDPHAIPAVPPRDRLGEITCPTFIIFGEDDIPDFHEISRLLHEGISGSMHIMLERAGHMANMDNPVGFNSALESFLGGVAGYTR